MRLRNRYLSILGVLLVAATLIGFAVGQITVTRQYQAASNVFIYATDVGLYLDSTCTNAVTAMNFGTLSNRQPSGTIVTWLCNKGTTNLNVNITLAKVKSPVPNDMDNGPQAPVRLYISNWQSVLNQVSQNMSKIQADFTVTIDPSRAVVGAYGWNITVTGAERP